jgi:hypothetical protein
MTHKVKDCANEERITKKTPHKSGTIQNVGDYVETMSTLFPPGEESFWFQPVSPFLMSKMGNVEKEFDDDIQIQIEIVFESSKIEKFEKMEKFEKIENCVKLKNSSKLKNSKKLQKSSKIENCVKFEKFVKNY